MTDPIPHIGLTKPLEVWRGEAPDPRYGYTNLLVREIALASLELADERLRRTSK